VVAGILMLLLYFGITCMIPVLGFLSSFNSRP
jgi:hypothetical protein